jgi:metal-sulfur cluster biosynthetic enzyme
MSRTDLPVVGEEAARLAAVRTDAARLLAGVIDPELGVDIVNLGLVYGLDLDADGTLSVHLAVTTPTCPLAGYLVHQARASLEGLDGVTGVWVDLALEPPWSPTMMSDAARRRLGWDG